MWLALVAALLASAVLAGPAAAAPATRLYTDSVSPVSAVAGTTPTPVSVTLTNSGTSTLPFGSAEVTLPAGATWEPNGVTSSPSGKAAAWSAAARTETDGRTIVLLRNTASGTTAAIAPRESVTLNLLLTAPTAGALRLTTAVKQSNDFSGSGNNFTRPTNSAGLVIDVRAQMPFALKIVEQPSTVQLASSPDPTSLARRVMCQAPAVAFVDKDGEVVTGLSETEVSLRPSSVDNGKLLFRGSAKLTTKTVGGVATFGDCTDGITATQLGTRLQVEATASYEGTEFTSEESDTFEVLPYYALCPVTCSTPELTGDGGTRAQVEATGGGTEPDLLQFAVSLDDAVEKTTYAACQPDPLGTNPYRDVVRVDVNNHAKAVTLRWTKQAVQWATNNGTKQWDVCLAAAYPFTARAPVVQAADGLYVGVLLPCADVDPLTTPCLSRLFRQAGEQGALVLVPNVNGDPKMW
jgi:hypothetical protein